MTMTDLAQVVNEVPVPPKEKAANPLNIRAQTVKTEMDQTRNLKIQLEDKEASIKVTNAVLEHVYYLGVGLQLNNYVLFRSYVKL